MRVIAWDSETALIRPACLAPPLVCVTYQTPGEEPQIVSHFDAYPLLRSWLEDSDTLLVGHNVAYDLAVVGEEYPDLLPAIFAAYDANRVTDTQIRQQLLDIAAGVYRGSVNAKGRRVQYEYTLEALAKRCAGMTLQKDEWRLSYAEFRGLPLDQWSARAREVQARVAAEIPGQETELAADPDNKDLAKRIEGMRSLVAGDPTRCTTYPLEDAQATLAVYQAQEKHVEWLKDQYRQAYAAFALHLSSAWGLRTDPEGVAKLRASVEEELEELDADLKEQGLVRPDGTRDTKVAKRLMIEVCREAGMPVVRTDTHFEAGKGKCRDLDGNPLPDGDDACAEHVCLDADACERSEDETVIAYAERTTLGKQLSNDIPALEKGTTYPVHTRYGMAATGRTTSSRPNIQNQSKRPGFREAFVPRPGKVFVQADYPGLELYTWAQYCKSWFGSSRLADALNAGKDPHLILAANLLGISYEEAAVNKKRPDIRGARDRAKPGNFGFAGGMGVKKFITATRKAMGRAAFAALGLDQHSAEQLKATWLETWPEAHDHFYLASRMCKEAAGEKWVEHLNFQIEYVKEASGIEDVPELFGCESIERAIRGFSGSRYTRRIRGDTTFCAFCNTPFQGLGADCAKRAACLIARACYVEPESPLYNARIVAFVHDEFILEVDDGPGAHDAAFELARLMMVGANTYLPDVPIPLSKIEPTLMRRWSKKAEQVFVDGRLVPWSPE